MLRNKNIQLLLLGSSIIFFVLGLVYPILRTVDVLDLTQTKWFSWIGKYDISDESNIRLIDSVKLFLSDNHYFLAVLIFLFTILFPIVKFLALLNKFFHVVTISKRINLFLEKLDKYSMLDVFLVAIIVMIFKMSSGILTMDIKLAIGTLFIAISVILRMLTSILMDYKKEDKID